MPHQVSLTQMNHGTFFLETVKIQGKIYHIKSINRNVCGLFNEQFARITLFRGHTELVTSATHFFVDEICMIVTGSNDHTLRIWHPHSGALLQVITPELGPVTQLSSYQHKGRHYIVSGHTSGALCIIDSVTQQIENRITLAHKGNINCITSYCDDEHGYIVTGGDDGKVQLWDAGSHQVIWDLPTRKMGQINCCTTFKNQQDDRIIVTAGTACGIDMWRTQDRLLYATLTQLGSYIRYCTTYTRADGNIMLVAGAGGGKLGIWFVDVGELWQIKQLSLNSLHDCSSYQQGTENKLILTSYDGLIVLSLNSESLTETLSMPRTYVCASTFYQQDDAVMIVLASLLDRSISLFNYHEGKFERKFDPPPRDKSGHATKVAVYDTSLGKLLVTCHSEGAVYIWNIADGRLLRTVLHHAKAYMIYTHQGRPHLVTAGSQHLMSIQAIGGDWSSYVYELAFGTAACFSIYHEAEQTRLVVGTTDGGLFIVNPNDGSIIFQLNGHIKAVDCCFTYEAEAATMLLTGSEDMTLRLWDLSTRTMRQEFRGIEGEPSCCTSYIVNGSRLFFSGHFGYLLCCWGEDGILRGEPLQLPATPSAIFCTPEGIYVTLAAGNIIFISFKNTAMPARVPSLHQLAATAFKQQPDYLERYPHLERWQKNLLQTTWLWPW